MADSISLGPTMMTSVLQSPSFGNLEDCITYESYAKPWKEIRLCVRASVHAHAHGHANTHVWQPCTFCVRHSANCAAKPSLRRERKRTRKDLNQDNVNKPVAGREKLKQLIAPGKSHCRISIKNSILEKLFERPLRGRNHKNSFLLACGLNV